MTWSLMANWKYINTNRFLNFYPKHVGSSLISNVRWNASFVGYFLCEQISRPAIILPDYGAQLFSLIVSQWAQLLSLIVSQWAQLLSLIVSQWAQLLSLILSQWAQLFSLIVPQWAQLLSLIVSQWAQHQPYKWYNSGQCTSHISDIRVITAPVT